jgi:RimJ/RimL family protein N-acetyltransferase
MSCFSACISALFSCCPLLATSTPSALSDYNWTETIHGSGMTFRLVTPARDESFLAICDMYKLSEENLAMELKDMVLWCIYNEDSQPVGAIQLNSYSSLSSLSKQVSDRRLAEYLFSSQKNIELSYALVEQSRGKGVGSKAVKAFIDHARSCNWGKHLFAVVSEENQPSFRILEKNRFSHVGNYYQDELKEHIRLYVL